MSYFDDHLILALSRVEGIDKASIRYKEKLLNQDSLVLSDTDLIQ